MKKLIIMTVILMMSVLFTAFTANAQDGRKVIAVVNKAGWCPVCQANGPRFMKEVMPMFKDSGVEFVMNDLTDETTKAASKTKLKEAHAYNAVKKIDATGLVLLVDAKTGKLLDKISMAEPTEKIINTIKESCTK